MKRALLTWPNRFFGNPSHLKAMQTTLEERFSKEKDGVEVLVPKVNTGLRSFDGVRLCSERVIEEVRSISTASYSY